MAERNISYAQPDTATAPIATGSAAPAVPVERVVPRERGTARPRLSWSSPFIYLMLFSYFIIVVYPMFWLFYTSLKSDREIFLRPFSLPQRPWHWENFSNAWIGGHFRSYFLNSVLI